MLTTLALSTLIAAATFFAGRRYERWIWEKAHAELRAEHSNQVQALVSLMSAEIFRER